MLCALAGYGLGFTQSAHHSVLYLFYFTIGTTFLSAGSLALNQVQEWRIDEKMPRTKDRPIPSGRIAPGQGLVFGVALILLGLIILFAINQTVALMGLTTVLLYNGYYTLSWKPKMAFAAVPGAIPGAIPVLMGYAAASPRPFTLESAYAFLIMFLWQMPHFWALAIRYRNDYHLGGFPVMPVRLGVRKTLDRGRCGGGELDGGRAFHLVADRVSFVGHCVLRGQSSA